MSKINFCTIQVTAVNFFFIRWITRRSMYKQHVVGMSKRWITRPSYQSNTVSQITKYSWVHDEVWESRSRGETTKRRLDMARCVLRKISFNKTTVTVTIYATLPIHMTASSWKTIQLKTQGNICFTLE